MKNLNKPLISRQLDDILVLTDYAADQGAVNGINTTRDEIAAALGWPLSRYTQAVQLIKQNPQEGYGWSHRRGSKPRLTLSYTGKKDEGKLPRDSVIEVENVSRAGRNESLLRLARYAAMAFRHYRNTKNKYGAATELHLRECRSLRSALSGAQACLDDSEEEKEVSLFIDGVLSDFPAAS